MTRGDWIKAIGLAFVIYFVSAVLIGVIFGFVVVPLIGPVGAAIGILAGGLVSLLLGAWAGPYVLGFRSIRVYVVAGLGIVACAMVVTFGLLVTAMAMTR